MHWLQCKTVTQHRGETVATDRKKASLLSLKSPQCKIRPPCQFWFWAQRLAVTEPEVPVLCAAVRLGFDTGQSDQSYANGNQMGRESLVDYRRRREACVFMYSYGDLGPLSFSSFLSSPFFKSNKWEQRCLLFARTLNYCSLGLDRFWDSLSIS